MHLCRCDLVHLIQMIEEVHMLYNKIKKVLFGQGGTGGKINSNIFFISFSYADVVKLHPSLRALRDDCFISCSFPERTKCLRSGCIVYSNIPEMRKRRERKHTVKEKAR